ncbi:glycosyl hydrolase family 28 protein, partial [Ralstonia pseudosolanacearum]|uniref:glycosyl hydrolase family 28 protein n=1 Tax=Ralstonia pseudosolanacearum TaxID=1310165 RepID=UPI003CFBAA4E
MDYTARTGLFLILFLSACIANVSGQPGIFNVLNFGAKADGNTDDAKAFLAAWAQACAAIGKAKVWIPQGTYLASTVEFRGPCKGLVEFQLDGTVKAPVNMAGQSNWIVFARITGLAVSGLGAFDAQGALAWSQNQCSNREKGGQCKFP